MKKTKIIATIGPASSKQATIEKMAKAGVDYISLSFVRQTEDTVKLRQVREMRFARPAP